MSNDGAPAEPEKPAILRESRFTVEEGFAYRAARTGAIWMNKLFFSSLVLAVVWLAWGGLTDQSSCVAGVPLNATAQADPAATNAHCNVFLTPTFTYLLAMGAITFALSIGFGVLGLIVGKKIVEATPAADEVGARKDPPSPPPT
jgi:hypothetical protein